MATQPHHSGIRYVAALAALLILVGLSWGLSYLPSLTGPLLALTIAVIKAVIVAAVFMHLSDARFTYRFVAVVTALFIAILCLGISGDVLFRWVASRHREALRCVAPRDLDRRHC